MRSITLCVRLHYKRNLYRCNDFSLQKTTVYGGILTVLTVLRQAARHRTAAVNAYAEAKVWLKRKLASTPTSCLSMQPYRAAGE
jgi:hypothetical protein